MCAFCKKGRARKRFASFVNKICSNPCQFLINLSNEHFQEIDREILKMDKLKQEAQAAVLERSDNIQEDCVHSI